jgi:myosin-5
MSEQVNVIPTAIQAVEVYTKGIKAWFPDKKEGWVSASCISNNTENDKVTIVFEDDNDKEKVLRIMKKSSLL